MLDTLDFSPDGKMLATASGDGKRCHLNNKHASEAGIHFQQFSIACHGPVRPIKSHSSPQIEGQMSGVKLSVRWNRVAVSCVSVAVAGCQQ
jgi:hypothetical protein